MWRAVTAGNCSGWCYYRTLLAIDVKLQKGSARMENQRMEQESSWLRIAGHRQPEQRLRRTRPLLALGMLGSTRLLTTAIFMEYKGLSTSLRAFQVLQFFFFETGSICRPGWP